jgi:hypothetical protein
MPESEKNEQEVTSPKNAITLPEYSSEVIYSDLLSKLLLYDQNISNLKGLWREQTLFLQHVGACVHLFNLPELHEAFTPCIFDYIKEGNSDVREAAADCLAKMLQY